MPSTDELRTGSRLDLQELSQQYDQVRRFTERLSEPLSAEDCAIQSMPDVSPTKWHLAHTTWFFETFVLTKTPGYEVFHPQFEYLYNSYYNQVGAQFPRPQRGLLSRPSLEEIVAYRNHVDDRVSRLLAAGSLPAELVPVFEIGLHHEQQHQELLLTDIKHVLSCNPSWPVYREGEVPESSDAPPLEWLPVDGGLQSIGHAGEGFAYDNESPRHRVFLEAFQMGSRLVTCREYLQFMADGGYQRPELWLSAGWQQVCEQGWQAPLYWVEQAGAWHLFTLAGLRPIDPAQPVCHVSYFEADAFAAWAGDRLPTEAEWEVASADVPIEGNFADRLLRERLALHPHSQRATGTGGRQMFGDVWEWTSSSYNAYPGFKPPAGALGEYNGKFMCNQYVLRGGSCATSQNHIRRTYRNFFPPDARWQFTGIRLARS